MILLLQYHDVIEIFPRLKHYLVVGKLQRYERDMI